MARIHRRTIQKNLNDLDNHNGVITQLEPDILECEVKWTLGSITMNKASGGDGILVELFQIIKDKHAWEKESVTVTFSAAKYLNSTCC